MRKTAPPQSLEGKLSTIVSAMCRVAGEMALVLARRKITKAHAASWIARAEQVVYWLKELQRDMEKT